MRYDFDLFTIGAGSGGVACSRRAASYGARVAICEEVRVGGTCVLRGCVPKKLLWYGAQFQEELQDAAGFGYTLRDRDFSFATLVDRKNQELDRLNKIYERMLRDAGVVTLPGRGTVIDPHTVEVAGKRYTAERILLSVGSHPRLPTSREVPGIEHAITSNEALNLPALPNRVVIVGGGYIGVEFAGIFNALGADVQMVLRGDTVLRGFDEDLRVHLQGEMESRGIEILKETSLRSIDKLDDGTFSVLVGQEDTLLADVVLCAIGRVPNTKGLGLAEVGVTLDEEGAVVVDDDLRTQVPSIYAVGDCINRVNLTPVAIAQGRAIAETLYNNRPTKVSYDNIPTAVFSHPPCATVGLTEEEARRQEGQTPGQTIDVYVASFRPMKGTLSGRKEKTLVKLLVRRSDDRVLGCHMVGPDAPEIIQGLAVALCCGATKAHFDRTIGIHPTAAEEFVTLRERRPPPEHLR